VIHLNGAPTADWSYLGNDTPENYLQFFSLSSTALAAGGSLQVTFDSIFAPSGTEFAVALNSATSQVSNQVNNVTAPGAVPTPEPASLNFLLGRPCCLLLLWPARLIGSRYRRNLQPSFRFER
jgi:hypothetical protein